MHITNTMTSLNNINTKVSKLFNNPNINFFIIMNLVLLISCYTFINTPLKNTISSFIANPIIILFTLIFIIMIGYHNINIGILSLLLLFIILFGSSLFTKQNINNNNKVNIEGFTDNTEYDDNDTEDLTKEEKLKKSEKKFAKKVKEDKTNSREDRINNFKDVLMGSLTKITKGAENEYKKGLLENKQIMYENEKKNNKNNNRTGNKRNDKGKGKENGKGKEKENFQTIETREFDPSKEEDTNFLITKEVLQDMINRIDYNFESNEYLKKYLKHRIEEIVELNKLVDEYED